MTATPQLGRRELALIDAVLSRHPQVTAGILFGSRAKGTATATSDIDLALEGLDDALQAEAITSELEELPLPFRFDVKALDVLRHLALREHIARVGIRIYPRKEGPSLAEAIPAVEL